MSTLLLAFTLMSAPEPEVVTPEPQEDIAVETDVFKGDAVVPKNTEKFLDQWTARDWEHEA